MSASRKREIADVVDRGAGGATVLPLARVKAGVWAADADGVQWVVDALYEPEYGPGVFRVGWGIIVPGAAAIIEKGEGVSSHFGTVSGDAGSLAERRRSITLLCLPGSGMGTLNRLWWRVWEQPAEALAERITGWLTGPLLPIFTMMSSPQGVVEFLERRDALVGRHLPLYPDPDEQALATLAAVKTVAGDKAGALAAASAWRAAVRGTEVLEKHVDQVMARIERYPSP
jgi:hypothetical protein